jgi:uncharacterized protein (DUF2267 family)
MSATGLDVFDTTIQKTNTWLKELMQLGGWENRQTAYRALRATLHALRDRLTVDETAQLSAQLPMLVRGLYFEGWDPRIRTLKERHLEQFLERIEQELRGDEQLDPVEVARTVFTVMQQRVTEGEIEDVRHMLPSKIRELWPVPEQAHSARARQSRPFAAPTRAPTTRRLDHRYKLDVAII